MKIRNLKYLFFAVVAFAITSCETYSDQEVEYSAIFPMSGEWLTHVYDEAGKVYGYDEKDSPTGTLFALRTYNTTANESNKAWIKLGSTQPVALLGKIDVDLSQKTLSGQTIKNEAKGGTFTIIEGKVLMASHPLPSGVNADSIYVKYTTTFDGKTYVVKGHRRTQWDPTE